MVLLNQVMLPIHHSLKAKYEAGHSPFLVEVKLLKCGAQNKSSV